MNLLHYTSQEPKSKTVCKILNLRTASSLVRYTIQAACIIVLFTVGIRNTIIASGSMEPTLMTGEMVMYNRLAYKFRGVQRGDIIAFIADDPFSVAGVSPRKSYYIKRVIAIEGDTIEFRNHQVYINGYRLDESAYLPEDTYTEPNPYTNCRKYTVPKDCVFVMGDCRHDSYDSRYFDTPFIPVENIEGKYLGTIPFYRKPNSHPMY